MTLATYDQDRARLQSLLRDLFQFDAADLDFGIYRILNMRREEIEQFIEDDLLTAVDHALAAFQQVEVTQLEEQAEEKRRALLDFAPDALDEMGNVVKYKETRGAQEYLRAREAVAAARVTDETRRHIFNDLYRFFSRYYDQGDFLTERRYSSREPKYAIPYNGEEVVLHWANRDQYYVKSSERHADYRFTVDGCAVWFKLESAQEPTDNVTTETRYFIPRLDGMRATPAGGDEEGAGTANTELVIPFEYRPLTDAEAARYLQTYNEGQTRSNRRRTLDRAALVQATEKALLDAVGRPDLKQVLARPYRAGDDSRSILGYHLNRYTARNTMDYFVHKELEGFLRRELDYFLKSEVLQLDDVLGDERGELARHTLARVQVIRQVAGRIISFLSQIEDFQKRLFEKMKFVVRTDYCVTLDRVPASFYPEILANEAQLAAWRELYAIDHWDQDRVSGQQNDGAFLRNFPYMMVDTRFFDEAFKSRLLDTFDDIERDADGLLIHGENYAALCLVLNTFQQGVKTIYIDPPYNTGNDGFIYKDAYQHSSWLTLMHDRLEMGLRLLDPTGTLYVSIDDREQDNLRKLLDTLTRPSAFLAQLVWEKVHTRKNSAKFYSIQHEYILTYAADRENWHRTLLPRQDTSAYSNPDDDPRGLWKLDPITAHNPYSADYTITKPNGIILGPPPDAYWRYSEESWNRFLDEGRVVWGEGSAYPMVKRYLAEVQEGLVPVTLFRLDDYADTDVLRREEFGDTALSKRELDSLFQMPPEMEYVKPTKLIKQVIRVSAGSPSDIVVDFFAGSGTTAHAVIDLNREDEGARKYILVEMGDHFNTVLKPRIQKVVFSDTWKDGVPAHNGSGVSHMFKYQRIESYEDALNNIVVERPEGLNLSLFGDELRQEYMLHYLLDRETEGSPTLAPSGAFDRPFDYQLLIQHGHESPQPTRVDLVETFHYLIGMHVRRLVQHEHQGRRYVVSRGAVRTENGIEEVAVIWRNTEGLDLEAEAAWVNAELLSQSPDRVYVNGESFIANAESLEFTFRNWMLAS